MRRAANAVLELVPEARRAQLRELLSRRLGSTAFEEPDEEPITDEELAAIEAEGAGELTLRAPELAGTTEPTADDPALDDEALDDESVDDAAGGTAAEGGEDGPALMLGDRNRFSLGGGSLSLQ
jgi:hypothetical protein